MTKTISSDRILNKEQKKAVRFGNGPLLIIAGAGTGKTTVITERIKYLILSKKANPQEILALTFTEKASREMEERIDVAMPYGTTQMWISTFHAFCDRILRNESLAIGLDPNYKLMGEAETVQFLKDHLFDFGLSYFRPLGNPTKFISGMLQHFNRLKDEDVDPTTYIAWVQKQKAFDREEKEKYKELAKAYRTYEELKVKESVVDYADLIANTLKLFRTRKKILEGYQKQFKYILIDEFQDTNIAQNELAILLAGSKKNITVVGDDDQCLPGDTKISVPNGKKEIQHLKKGDIVLTGVGKGRIAKSSITHVWKRKKKTEFITIKTESGQTLTSTVNHNLFCYIPKKEEKKKYYYVYLMLKKSLGWRLGISNDLSRRLKLERSADAIVGLRAFKTEEEARYYEYVWSLQYALPTSIFKERDGVMRQGEYVDRLYKEIDTETNARKLASYLGVDLSRYHYLLEGVTRGASKRVVIHVSLCYRNYTSKRAYDLLMINPKISHQVTLETSNTVIIQKLIKAHIHFVKAKKGIKVVCQSSDIHVIEDMAKKLQFVTGGFIEVQSMIGKYNSVHLPANALPAGNILPGHFLPVVRKNYIYYDRVVGVKREAGQGVVYDLEIDKTHNFIANNIVVHNSIYRFRGSSVSNILQFSKKYKKVKKVVLTKNYRSTQEILNRSYALIQHNNPDRLEVVEKINKQLECVRRVNGEKIDVLYTERVEDEAEAVAKTINAKCQMSNATYKDFAILVRANNHAEPFVRALSRAGIPYQFLGPGQLFKQPEVKDIIAYLKVLYDIHDSVAMYRVITMDTLKVSPRDVAEIVSYAKQHAVSIFSASEELQENIPTVKPVVAMIHKHLGLIKKETAGQIAYYFLQDCGLLKEFTTIETTKDQHKAENIAAFFDKLKTYEVDHEDASVFRVVDWLDLSMDLGESPLAANLDWSEIDAVNILTIHSAKGLEFPIVFLVNLVSARFPTNERHEQIPIPDAIVKEILPVGDYHLEEERRLFYVGMTRAKDLLYMTGAKFYGDGKREKKLSPFIEESIGSQAIQSVKKASDEKQLFLIDWRRQKKSKEKITTLPVSYLWYTHIESFRRCPLQYKYRYVIKIPVPTSAVLGFGDIIHKSMQEFYQRVIKGERPTKETLLSIYENKWKSNGFMSKAYENDMKKHGEELLDQYFEKGYDPKTKTIAVEQAFKIKITKDISLGGRIDRVDRKPDGILEIIDYKTGAAPKKRDVSEDFQLSLYALAATDKGLFGEKPEHIIVSFYFFEGQERMSATRSKEQLEKVKDEIAKAAQDIGTSKFYPTPGMYCAFCEFRLICEAWK